MTQAVKAYILGMPETDRFIPPQPSMEGKQYAQRIALLSPAHRDVEIAAFAADLFVLTGIKLSKVTT